MRAGIVKRRRPRYFSQTTNQRGNCFMNPEQVIATLESAGGYKRVAQPMHIADTNFDFAGALIGPGDHQALTVILESNHGTIAAALRRLKSFAIVLARSGSSRPISVVLISADPDRDEIAALEEVARVIIVRPGEDLDSALHSLLPLQLPLPIPPSESAERMLREEMRNAPTPVAARLLRAAKKSSNAVEDEMRKILMELTDSPQ